MDLDEQDYEGYVRRIRQIDSILLGPVKTLIKLVTGGPRPRASVLQIPQRIKDDRDVDPPQQLNEALCCAALQSVLISRRRFPALEDDFDSLRKALEKRPRKPSEGPGS